MSCLYFNSSDSLVPEFVSWILASLPPSAGIALVHQKVSAVSLDFITNFNSSSSEKLLCIKTSRENGQKDQRINNARPKENWFLQLWVLTSKVTQAQGIFLSSLASLTLLFLSWDPGSHVLTVEEDRKRNEHQLEEKHKKFSKGMSLCVCYAASIGGIATLTGTTTNLVLQGQVNQ